MDTEKVLKKFDSIVSSYSKKDKIAIIHDLDSDGISSGVIVFNAIKLLRGREPDLVVSQSHKTVELLPKTIGLLKQRKINKVVVVDFALDQQAGSIKKAEEVVDKILVLDHHKDYGFKGSKKTFIIKADYIRDIDSSKYPTSKLVYDLFSRHVDLSDYSWVASVGLIGDNQLEQWRVFVEESKKAHNSKIEDFHEVSLIISAVEVLAPEKLNDLFYFIARSSSPKEIIGSAYASYLKTLHIETEKILKEFEEKKVVFGKQELIWFEFYSDYHIKSAVINRVSNEIYPNKTVLFLQDKGDDFIYISGRRQDFKVRVNDLLENAVKGFEESGAGGHIPAAAGRIKKTDLAEFKERIMKLLEL